MTLDQLEMVEAVISEGSYQAAAKKLNKSQPSLSTGIKKIEELYAIKIFSREGYRPVLTEVGRRFYDSAKDTLSSYRQLHKLASDLGAGIEPEINISVDPIIMAQGFYALFDVFKKHQYKSVLSIKSGVLFDNAHCLLRGEVDLALGHFPQVDNEKIEQHKICSIDLVPVIHKDLIYEKKLSKSFLQSIPNIIVQTKLNDEDNISSSSGHKWFVEDHGRKTELIFLGMGWGRVSKLQLVNSDEMHIIPNDLVEAIHFDIHLMRKKDRPAGPIAREIWKVMTS